ncbi:MAG: DUF5106 domain-containing protein, partial [Bacteroidia bacterium]
DSLIRPGMYLFVLPPKNVYFEFLIDKNNQVFSLETDSVDMAGKMKVTGSPENQGFFRSIQFLGEKRKRMDEIQRGIKEAGTDSVIIKKLQKEAQSIDDEVKNMRTKAVKDNANNIYGAIIRATTEPEVPPAPKDAATGKPLDPDFAYHYYKGHFWDGINFTDESLLRTPLLQQKIDYYLDKLVAPIPDSINKEVDPICLKTITNKEMYKYFVVTILNKYANSKRMGDDAVYVHMVDEYYIKRAPFWSDSAQTRKIIDRANALRWTLIGADAPPLSILDMNDNRVTMRDVPADWTILYFWDYDCGHCKKVTPRLQKVADYYLNTKKANIKFYTVDINGTREKFKEAVKEYKLDMPGVINTADPRRETGFDRMYDILSTPRILVLDKDKKIRYKYISAKQLDEILNHELYKGNGSLILTEADEDKHDEDKHEGVPPPLPIKE